MSDENEVLDFATLCLAQSRIVVVHNLLLFSLAKRLILALSLIGPFQ